MTTGTELIAFVVVSSRCCSHHPQQLIAALPRIRAELSQTARAHGLRFIYAGVALEDNAAKGLDLLQSFGPFDEVIAGGSWTGTGSVDLLTRAMPGPLELPQVVVIQREVNAGTTAISIGQDHLVRRIVGFPQVLSFAGASALGGP